MVDFSVIFILFKYISEYIQKNVRIDISLFIMIFAIATAVLFVISLIFPKTGDDKSKKVSYRNFFSRLWRISFVFFVIFGVIYIWPIVVRIMSEAINVSERNFKIFSVGTLITLLCAGLFISSRFFPNVPSNNSLCNTRQVLTWTSYCTMILLVFFVLYNINFTIFRTTMVTIFFVTEMVSVLFWFYDPFIYILSQFVHRKPKVPCEPTPNKLNRFAVIGCAHNEERVIDQLIKSLYATVYPKNKYDIYVICDNCTDNTADVVRKAGAIAMERNDAERRGKGYGLEWMFAYLEEQSKLGNEYDAYIVLDADNLVNEEYLYAINEKMNEGHEILQTYLGCKNPKDTWIAGSYSYCYWVSNTIYQMAHSKVNLSAQMGGTGMILRPSVLREIGWETDSLTEDLVLTVRYVSIKNLPCCWVHDAKLYDEKPLKLKPSIRQRTRWMQGHMAAMFKFAPKLFLSGLRHMSLKQLDVAFYLSRPFLNIVMFVCYLIRIYFNIFMPETMSVSFIMSNNTSLLLMIGHFVLQFYVLFCERYGRYIFLSILQLVFSFTWYPAIFRGLIKRNERYWLSTEHTRNISIKDVGEDARLIEAKERLKGMDNLHVLPLGQILVKATAITKKQLDTALEEQSKTGGRLGDIIVEMNILSKDILDAYLQLQKEEKESGEHEGSETYQRHRLGDMLVESKLITQEQLDYALERQHKKGGLIGENLISTQCITSELMATFLEVQKLLDANYISMKRTKILIDGILSNKENNLGTILWNGGLISRQQLDYALEQQKLIPDKQIGSILVQCDFINRETLLSILELQKFGREHMKKMQALEAEKSEETEVSANVNA
jgi:Glycosyltransferases, probably involved in cell wall biogenesis